jgi:hypothetical protein
MSEAGMSTSDLIALCAAAGSTTVGLLAIWVSLRANRTSAAAKQIAERAYAAEHRLALTSTAGKDERGAEYLLLSPAGSDQTINSVTLFFPGKTGISPVVLASGAMRLFHTQVAPWLKRYWDSRTPTISGKALVRLHAPTPVVALLHGFSRGEVTISVGYYDLYCQYSRLDDGSSSLTILSLALNNYGSSGDDLQQVADRILAAHESTDVAVNSE